MSSWQRRLFAIAFAGYLLAHLVSLITTNQYWPVVSYTVLATRNDDTFECYVPYGVPEDAARPGFRVWNPHLEHPYHRLRFPLLKIMEYPWRNSSYDAFAAGCPTDGIATT